MRRLSTLTVVWLLQAYAFLLALFQMLGGVRTDEAKYLLSIPYPHPPLVRTVMVWTSGMVLHEFFWRLVFATLAVQSVWLLVDLGAVLTKQRRLCLALSWLLSAAVVLNSGSIVMVVCTAAFGLLFLWMALHPEVPLEPAAIACLWLASLFTAYQSVLYAPLVLSALLHARIPRTRAMLYFFLPIILLALYTAVSPHVLLTMAKASTQDAVIPLFERLGNIGWIWLLAGSVTASIAGTVGILTSVRWDLVSSFGLVMGFVVLTSQHYYAILLTPLFMGGLYLLLCRRRLKPVSFVLVEGIGTLALVAMALPAFTPTSARAVMRQLKAQGITGPVLIDGYFGHEWQYESHVPILRFSQELGSAAELDAQALVCTRGGCDEDVNVDEWVRLPGMPLEVWIRR